MSSSIFHNLLRQAKNIPGWRTDRKIIVIESDDWGSIRMPSTEVYNIFLEKGFQMGTSLYNRYDTLESETDLLQLFETLSAVKDANNNPAVFTANCIVANPDFDKIQQSDFKAYYYEKILDTLHKYPEHANIVSLWKEGLRHKIFKPQSHGREHVNIERWMKKLRSGDADTLFCFYHHTTYSGGEADYSFMEALDYDHISQIENLNAMLRDGLRIFQQIMGYCSKSFIAPSYIWHSDVESALADMGVHYIQGLQYQFIPKLQFGHYKRRVHYLGQRNKNNQAYLIRNCSFEPTLFPGSDPVDKCLKEIETAFKWNKPAVITSHRLNYIGYLVESNRTKNLILLKRLLTSIRKKWPSVEFMSTDQLGDLVTGVIE